jgi:hypothetical protein
MKSLRKSLKKIAATGTLMAMALTSTNQLQAQEYCSQVAGCGYEESYCCPSMTPYILLGTIAVVAIIVLAVSNSHHKHHGHCH